MRRPIKFRLFYLLIAVVVYTLGIKLMPETLEAEHSLLYVYIFSTFYFVVLPLTYWFCVIKASNLKAWKLIIAFSLSSLVARYSFPLELTEYFEFVMWIRYPLIAALIAVELYISFSVIRGLWNARKAAGDPRITAFNLNNNKSAKNDEEQSYGGLKGRLKSTFKDNKQDSKVSIGVLVASEPASWYYAIPYFSRKHPKASVTLNSIMAKGWHFCLSMVGSVLGAVLSYYLLFEFSIYLAYFVAGLFAYGFIFIVANYRVAKNYSVYIKGEQLIINSGMWSFFCINLSDISDVEIGNEEIGSEEKVLGNRIGSHIKLQFKTKQMYFSPFNIAPEQFDSVNVFVDKPETLKEALVRQAKLDASCRVQVPVR